MIVLHVISHEFNGAGKRMWILFEVEATGIAEICDRLNAGHLIYGHSLKFRTDPEDKLNSKIVYGSYETTIQRDEVHKIQQPTWRLVRYETDEAEESTEALLLTNEGSAVQ